MSGYIWLTLKNTLPDNRKVLTLAEIKKIRESVGYGEIIKIGESPVASTSRVAIMNSFMNLPTISAPRPVINNEWLPRRLRPHSRIRPNASVSGNSNIGDTVSPNNRSSAASRASNRSSAAAASRRVSPVSIAGIERLLDIAASRASNRSSAASRASNRSIAASRASNRSSAASRASNRSSAAATPRASV